MEEFRIPTFGELCELAECYVESLDDEYLPISEVDLTEEILEDFANEHGYTLLEDQIDDLIDYIMSSSEEIYSQIIRDALQKFRDSLEDVITDADEILSDEDKLRVMVEVASSCFCEYY